MAFTWATAAQPASTHPIRRAICIGSGKFVACGDNGVVITSVDSGGTWTQRTTPSANRWRDLAYDGTTIVSVANSGAGTRAMFSTDDGVTWTASTTVPEANNWIGVCSPSVGTFVAVSSNGVNRTMRSTDSGANWSAVAASSALSWGGVATDGTLIVAKALEDVMVSSDAGVSWTSYLAACPTYNGSASVIRYSTVISQFLGAGYNGSNEGIVYGASDGQTWAAVGALITTHLIDAIGFIPADALGGFVTALPFTSALVASPTIVGWSDDAGATWTVEDTTFSGTWVGAAWDPGTNTAVFFDSATDTALVGTSSGVTSLSPSFGPSAGGTVVTILGSGLSGVTSVTFGGTAALSVTATDTTITCVTPPHVVGLFDVVVVGIGTLTNAFSFVEVTRVSRKAGTVAGGVAVTITGFGFAAASSVLFGGVAATDVVVVSNRTITAVTPAHASGRVDVEVVGVATGEGLYTYTLPIPQNLGKGPLLPPIQFIKRPS